ncbi:MAG: molybdopterin-dependent oxidoreductase [Steroidobacteraceae bacterium]
MSRSEVKSFCRICAGSCGVRIVVENERIVEIRGDKSHPLTQGYACIKGLKADVENGPKRLLRPQKRQRDGSFQPIELEQALDEVASKLKTIIERDGADAVACFRGTPNYFNCSAYNMLPAWMNAIGSKSFYSSLTIDQSAKIVTAQRMGTWAGGRPRFQEADLWMLAGSNPLVSLSFGLGSFPSHPLNMMRAAKARGMKLICIDPRRSETAAFADLHLQPLPGEDPTIAAGLIHIILKKDWIDHDFCARYVNGLDELRQAVAPFTPDYVAARARVPKDQLIRVAEIFGRESRNGRCRTGSGPNMAAHSNLAEHLYDCLNVICGRFLRAGDAVDVQPLQPVPTPRAEVIPPTRPWEQGHRSRVSGFGTIMGEMMSGALAEEMLTPGKDQLRSMFVLGGNPVAALPDTNRSKAAFSALELLVAVDPYLTATSRLAHYIFPPTTQYEHPELTPYFMNPYSKPFAQYTPAIVPPPPGSQLVEDWYPLWATASRLGLTLNYADVQLSTEIPPTTDELLGILAKDSLIPLEELKRSPQGMIADLPPTVVQPARPDATGRFELAPPDVVREIRDVLHEAVMTAGESTYAFRLSTRRMRNVMNSDLQDLPSIRRHTPHNPAYLNPEDLSALGVAAGDRVEIVSEHGRIEARVAPDITVRRGVVSMSHAWGTSGNDTKHSGSACTNVLVSSETQREPINAMPRYSAIPVNIRKLSSPAHHSAQRSDDHIAAVSDEESTW